MSYITISAQRTTSHATNSTVSDAETSTAQTASSATSVVSAISIRDSSSSPSFGTAEFTTGEIIGLTIGCTTLVLVVSCLVWRERRRATAITAFQSPEGELAHIMYHNVQQHDLMRASAAQVSVSPTQPPLLSLSEGAHPAPALGTKSRLRMVGHTPTFQQQHEEISQLTAEGPDAEGPQSDVAVNHSSTSAASTSEVLLQHSADGTANARTPQRRDVGRQPRCETDGGIRLAGGPLGAVSDDDVLSDVSSTLPPPYNVY